MDHRVMPTDTQSSGGVCCNPHQNKDRRSHPGSEEESQGPLTHLTASFPSLAPSPAMGGLVVDSRLPVTSPFQPPYLAGISPLG